jgi:hypothetical protein
VARDVTFHRWRLGFKQSSRHRQVNRSVTGMRYI